MIRDFFLPQLECKKAKYQARYSSNCGKGQRLSRYLEGNFRCVHCQAYVTTDSLFSGVQNRNHCPYCLWSRHLDLDKAGDRLAACKAAMQPIGLTLKQAHKKYACVQPGELMLIHLCTDCGKLSINRIAADDDADLVLAIYDQSCRLDEQLLAQLESNHVIALSPAQRSVVNARLFGQNISPTVELDIENAAICRN